MAGEILYTEEQIQGRVSELAGVISQTHSENPPLLIGILSGGIVLLADLIRHLSIPFDCAFLSLTSLGQGDFRVLYDSSESVRGRAVILVDGAIVSGTTHRYLLEWLKLRGAVSVEFCAIVAKSTLPSEIPPGLLGFRTDRFVVGYGIAHRGQYRGLPYLVETAPSLRDER